MIAIILPIVGTIIFLVIWLFDLRIMELIKEKNKRDHKVSALFYDYLSNIKTIITLRFIEKTWDVMRSKIDDTYPPFRKRIVIDEWKWTIVTLVLALSIGLMIGLYTHNHIVLT
ncbi:hypothetical protein KBC03_07875 [Patescibacteria group bacterium]|nr:hypothetical protein [Patescibacteria group bacterium]